MENIRLQCAFRPQHWSIRIDRLKHNFDDEMKFSTVPLTELFSKDIEWKNNYFDDSLLFLYKKQF